jgi:hypothetical protein
MGDITMSKVVKLSYVMEREEKLKEIYEGLPAPIFCDITAIIPDDITPNIIIKTPIYVLAVPTAPTAWSLTDDSISVSTIPESI